MTETDFNAIMDSITEAKKEARKNGYHRGPLVDTQGMYNGHIVEIAVCHLLGVTQRYLSIFFQVEISTSLDKEGVDIQVTADGKVRNMQLKHTFRSENRERNQGEYILSLHNNEGFRIIEDLFRFYKIPLTLKDFKTYKNLQIELDYVWLMYTESISSYYASKY